MKPINIHEAKTHLSCLIERVQAGEEFVIAKAGRPAARLVPLEPSAAPVKTGGLKMREVPDDFDSMFEEEIATLFSSTRSCCSGTPPAPGGSRLASHGFSATGGTSSTSAPQACSSPRQTPNPWC